MSSSKANFGVQILIEKVEEACTARIMNKPKSQHLISRTYLKHFRIDGEIQQSFVYCFDLTNAYRRHIQRVGLKDKVFTEDRYYNDISLEEPYAIENIYGEAIEPQYERIMLSLNQMNFVSTELVELLMSWIIFSKMKSPYMRNRAEKALKHIIESKEAYPDLDFLTKENASYYAKEVHLKMFTERKNLDEFGLRNLTTLYRKSWEILIAPDWLPFITNDNPGFSVNLKLIQTNPYLFSSNLEEGVDSVVLYVLSPKYCLQIGPFDEGTPLNACAINILIPYKVALPRQINWINMGVALTCQRLIISNKKNVLEKIAKAIKS